MASSLIGEYKFLSINGESSPEAADVRLSITAAAETNTIKVHAVVANTFNGEWTQQSDGTWKGPLMSTLMLGSEFLMSIERVLSAGGVAGARLRTSTAGGKLRLTVDADTLLFKRVRKNLGGI